MSSEFASSMPAGGSGGSGGNGGKGGGLAEAYRKARTMPTAGVQEQASEPEESFLPGTAVLGRRHQIMLQLCMHKGNAQAFGYNYLVAAAFDPSVGISLDFSGFKVRLGGRNLQPLFDALINHKVSKIFETEPLHALVRPESDTVVTRIEVEALV